jgi:hypothetical protein
MKFVARLFLVLVVVMPWMVSTLSAEQLRSLASAFKFAPSSDYFYSIGTPHAMEECIDFGLVLVSAFLFAGMAVGSRSTRGSILKARARRPIRLRDRLTFLAMALLAAFPWFVPGYVINGYSGASVGLVSRLIDTNALARGVFFAMLLLMAVFCILGVVFIVFGTNGTERKGLASANDR